MTEPLGTRLASDVRGPIALPDPPPIPASRRIRGLVGRAWPFAAWLLALAACGLLYRGGAGAGAGHALALEEGEELQVYPSLAGRVATIAVSPGQAVRAGDVLATLDARDLDRRLAAAKEALERFRTKAAGKNAPGGDKDLEAQESKVADLEAERKKYSLLAPVAGTVNRIAAKIGDRRSPGSGLIDLLVARPQELTAFVTDRQLSLVVVGSIATIVPRDLPGPALEGKVVRLGPQIEQLPARLRSIPGAPSWGRRVVLEVKTPGPSLPGQTFDVRFH